MSEQTGTTETGAKTDLQRAFEALTGKQATYDNLFKYYDGDHPLVYSAKRLREIFHGLGERAKFAENWCAVVVDSVLDRLELQRFAVGEDEKAGETLNALWKATEMDLDADDAHLAALITGEAFVIAWRTEGSGTECYFNDPRWCHVEYDPENPRRKAWAAKWWVQGDGRYRLNLYYPERIEYYVTDKAQRPSQHTSFVPVAGDPVRENPFGAIPIFHLRRERREIRSELANVIPLQAAINKLLADMMVAAEFGAFNQRWIISNADTSTLKNAPNEIWTIPAGDGVGEGSKVGQFTATDLSNFIKAIDNLANAAAAISRTPRHFFFSEGEAPSGEALIVMEAPLNKKAGRYIARFGNTWQRVAAFLLFLETGKPVEPETITPVFAEPETVQPKSEADIRKIRVEAGEPLVTVMRSQGASDAEIEQMLEDKRQERAEAQSSLARALLEQQRQFDQRQGGE